MVFRNIGGTVDLVFGQVSPVYDPTTLAADPAADEVDAFLAVGPARLTASLDDSYLAGHESDVRSWCKWRSAYIGEGGSKSIHSSVQTAACIS